MNKILLTAAIAVASLAATAPALARDGCGAGWYRAWDGRCYAMGRTVVVERPVYGYGYGYYRGWHGYGPRYHEWHRGWRYR